VKRTLEVRWLPAWELVNSSNSSVVEYSPDSNDVSTEVKKSPLFRSVTGTRLVKADYEDLACVVVICKNEETSDSVIVTCS
jgi:hypothetical protein